MVFHKDRYEISVAYEKFSDTLHVSKDVPKSCSDENSEATSGKRKISFTNSFFTEVQRYKVAAVVFGLICLLQLTFIIFLSLSASHHKIQNEKEKSELKTINFAQFHSALPHSTWHET
ncbi:hypothetical protein ILYODFUR_029332 [Ilyodon furcidens]|uniref:Uncharacterized protein n=1 Tax=Ilyodon furcidens TaxID=33524 RepID=A0ABV0V040_9TELE